MFSMRSSAIHRDYRPAAAEPTGYPWHDPAVSATANAFLGACRVARDLIARPEVAQRWEDPSALAQMTVGTLGGHLSRPPMAVLDYCAAPAPPAGAQPSSPAQYFAAVLPTDDIDSDVHRGIRARSIQAAEGGPAAVLERLDRAIADVAALLAREPADRLIEVFGGVVMWLEDYVVTRIVEVVVHADDLAVSVDLPPPDLPAAAESRTRGVLVELAAIRYGSTPVRRLLSRRERPPQPPPTAF
nr:hypothetical protein [uncultured bacterium]